MKNIVHMYFRSFILIAVRIIFGKLFIKFSNINTKHLKFNQTYVELN